MKDEIIAGAEWSFDESVAVVFDDMLSRSIPGYEEMRNAVIRMVEPIVLDLGCSHGEMIAAMQQKFSSSLHLSYVGIDYSSAMVTRARQRFYTDDTVSIIHADLKDVELTRLRYDVVLSILPCSSMSTFAIRTLSENSESIPTSIGAIVLHGPHHSAQKSTRTGSEDVSITVSKSLLFKLTIIIPPQ